MKNNENMPKKEWWMEYVSEGDYCECHDMCEGCCACSCMPYNHVKEDNVKKLVDDAIRRGKIEALNYLKKCLSDDCEGDVHQTMQRVSYTIELVNDLIEETEKSTN